MTRHTTLLKLTGTNCIYPSSINTRSIMTNEGSTLVKVTSDMGGYHHCVCAFHINQLAVRVSSFFPFRHIFVYTKCMLSSFSCQHIFWNMYVFT